MRYALRIDANQTQIVSALEAHGIKVDVIGKPVDLLCGLNGRFCFLEVKDGKKVPSDRKTTTAQDKFLNRWSEYPVAVVKSPNEAIAAILLFCS